MKDTHIRLMLIGAAFAIACNGKEEDETTGPLCTELPVQITVVNSSLEPVSDAVVKMDNVECTGDGTSNIYDCVAIQNATGQNQLVIIHPNANAYAEFLVLPAPEDWCDSPAIQHDVQLGVMMGS